MLRSPLLVTGHVLTVDVIGLVHKMVGEWEEYKNTQSWTKSVKNFTLCCTRGTQPVNVASGWPLPDQCCYVQTRNVPVTLQHCFLGGGGSILTALVFGVKYSKMKHRRCIFLNIFVQDCWLL